MAPFGVMIGIIITSIGTGVESEGAIVILEAIATGTFLYVTFLELVPHEFIGDVKNGPLKAEFNIDSLRTPRKLGRKNRKIGITVEVMDRFLSFLLCYVKSTLSNERRNKWALPPGAVLALFAPFLPYWLFGARWECPLIFSLIQ